MAGQLIFNSKDVAKAIEEANKTYPPEQRRPTIKQFLDAGVYDAHFNADPEKQKQVHASVLPELHLVKDEGTYLMANVWFPGITIVYAQGCDPKKDPDTYYETSREIMGGDDCVESIPIKDVEPLIQNGADQIIITVDATHLTITARGTGTINS
jgi:hypothetical protein